MHPRTRRILDLSLLIAAPAALIMTGLAAFGIYLPGDVRIERSVQSVDSPGLRALSDAIYLIGAQPWFYILGAAVGAVLYAFRYRLLAGFAVVAVLSYNTAFLIKQIVERPRPSPEVVQVERISDSFSFPSGHVMGAVMLWGFVLFASHVITRRELRLGVQALAVAMIVLMGLQRIYEGAHWPTDVLAAYLWGAVVLVVIIRAFEFVRTRSRRRPRADAGEFA